MICLLGNFSSMVLSLQRLYHPLIPQESRLEGVYSIKGTRRPVKSPPGAPSKQWKKPPGELHGRDRHSGPQQQLLPGAAQGFPFSVQSCKALGLPGLVTPTPGTLLGTKPVVSGRAMLS